MRVLLTGATGFVGSHVARLLVREGCEVAALVRPASDSWRIGDVRSRLHVIAGDILDLEGFDGPLRSFNPTICIHLGWYATPGKYLHAPENVDLMAATIRFATRLTEIGCKRFVGVGTCFEYDTAAGYLSETSHLDPSFLYSAAKAGTYMVLKNLSLGAMTVAWARLFYLYGPFENEQRLVPAVINALLSGDQARCTLGEQVRDFLHVEDVASALWCIAQSPIAGAVNVGSGSPVTVARLVTTIGAILKRPDLVKLGAKEYGAGDPLFICANTQRLRTETTWQPRVGLDEGLRMTVDWWRSRGKVLKRPEVGDS